MVHKPWNSRNCKSTPAPSNTGRKNTSQKIPVPFDPESWRITHDSSYTVGSIWGTFRFYDKPAREVIIRDVYRHRWADYLHIVYEYLPDPLFVQGEIFTASATAFSKMFIFEREELL